MASPFDPEKITMFGQTDARGQNIKFGIKAKDRTKHMYVIGKSGMGKSTLLENLAVQDIQSGEGMAFIDPHGSSAEVLLDYVPEHRKDDVLYFAPFDMAHPISFNIMEDVGADKRHLVVSGLMSVFEKIFVDAWSARMSYILQNTLMALLEYPGSTLLGVNRMLSDANYRLQIIDNIKDPSVKSFWVDEFLKYNERYMQEAGDSIKNKIGQFANNPIIRNIIGQPKSSFDIREMMDQQKILIMNLSKGLIGETNANLLGSMLTTRIYLAAMSRADVSPFEMKSMPNYYFYVDEFQSFANSTFANILSEARKYKLNLTIAHQYIEQMEEDVRNAVFGNVGTTVTFRVGPMDAEFLEQMFAPQFEATDICNLGFTQIYLSLMIDGVGSQPFSATTLPPIEPLADETVKKHIIEASKKNYARPRQEVEDSIDEFYKPVPKPAKNDAGGGRNFAPNGKAEGKGGLEYGQYEAGGSTFAERQAAAQKAAVAIAANKAAEKAKPPAAKKPKTNATPNAAKKPAARPAAVSPDARAQSSQTKPPANTKPKPNRQPPKSKDQQVADLKSVLKGMVVENTKPVKKDNKPAAAKGGGDVARTSGGVGGEKGNGGAGPEAASPPPAPRPKPNPKNTSENQPQNTATEKSPESKKPNQSNHSGHTSQNTQSKKPTENNALRDALAGLQQATMETKSPPKPAQPPKAPSPTPPPAPQHNQPTPTPAPAPPVNENTAVVAQNTRDTDTPSAISAKELERMMRVSSHERPPIR